MEQSSRHSTIGHPATATSFFDYRTETSFCKKGDCEGCGHELMHWSGHHHPEGSATYP
jgi:hypothetical protein